MNEIITRAPSDNEIPALKKMWNTVFGSVGIESFFRHFFDADLCVIAEGTDSPAAMGYLLPVGDFFWDTKAYRCAMIYSVATLPAYRARGLATAVTGSLISLARELAYPAVLLCPSDDKLFDYYKAHTKLREWFYVSELVVKKTSANTDIEPPTEITANVYHLLREELLKGVVHVKQDLHIFEYQAELCKELGGGLFRVGDAIAVVERQVDGRVWIKELLLPDGEAAAFKSGYDITGIIASIASRFPACEYTIRSPAPIGKRRRFGMISFPDDTLIFSSGNELKPWFGMAFD